MDFRNVLVEALKICGEHADDPFLLYCTICDIVGNNLVLAHQITAFNNFNRTYRLVFKMKQNPGPRMILTLLEKCKKQPDSPEKLCWKWIHTLFVFYYRTNHHK